MVQGEFQGKIWGDGSTVHHPNYVGAPDIRREDNELMRYKVHRLDGMYYLSINAISFSLCQMEASSLLGAEGRRSCARKPFWIFTFCDFSRKYKREKQRL